MNIITLDFETFFSDDYSLSKMTTESYIRDSRFQAHGCAIRMYNINTDKYETRWLNEPEFRVWTSVSDFSTVAILCHHAQFDGLILSHHYGVKPRVWLDTLSMARLLLGNHLSVSLDSLAKHYQLAAKTVPYSLFKGKHWAELDEQVRRLVSSGACHDVELTWQLFQILAKDFPREEYSTVDTTIRMFTEPKLTADVDLLAKIWEREANTKTDRLAQLGVHEADLQSADKFAELLRAEGVEPETKNGKKKQIYCFAKTDQFMRDLLEDDNDRVRTLAEARLGVKSTLMQTRAETLGWMARRGSMPVYLRYCGAHTTRWSGGDGANWQNFKRGSDLRRAILPPPGYALVKPDLSQVECRLLNFLAGQNDVVEKFRNHEDPYTGIASQFYDRPITRADPLERGTGKQAELSCGYGCGPPKFQATARLGIYGPPVMLSAEESERFVALYRGTHPAVTAYWRYAEGVIKVLAQDGMLRWGPLHIEDQRIWLPNGCPLIYDTLEWHVDDDNGDRYWRMKTRNGWTKLYGAKLVEQTTQALARVLISQAMIRIRHKGYDIVNSEHDSIWVLIKKDGQEARYEQDILSEMVREPEWLPGLPLAAEINT